VDLDADGTPEIVLPGEDGLHVYRRSDQGYAEVSRWDVFPALRVSSGRQPLWPPEKREIVFPVSYSRFDYVIEGNRLAVVLEESCRDAKTRYRTTRYTIDPAKGFAAVPDAEPEEVSEPFPWQHAMSPFRLNDGHHTGLVGIHFENSPTSVLNVPLTDTYISTDGGKAVHSLRTQSMYPKLPFVDFNEDGNVDLATWTTNIGSELST
jgi:hypothetical protein